MAICKNLNSLDDYLASVEHDIIKFNQYVQFQLRLLRSRGQRTEDLLLNLFKAYSKCSDKAFAAYVKRKEDAHLEGHTLTSEQLMTAAKMKYQLLVDNKSWNAPSPEDCKLTALAAELAKVKKKAKAATKSTTPRD